MKIALLLVALFAFSSELFAGNSDVNKSKVTLELKKNLWDEFNTLAREQQERQMEEHPELWTDDWDDDWEELDFEALKLVTAEQQSVTAEQQSVTEEQQSVTAEQKAVTEEQKKLWKILFANNKK